MQPSVYGEEYLHGIAGVQRRSLHIPAALHPEKAVEDLHRYMDEKGKLSISCFSTFPNAPQRGGGLYCCRDGLHFRPAQGGQHRHAEFPCSLPRLWKRSWSPGKNCNLKGTWLFWNMVDRRGRKDLYDAWNRVIDKMGLRLLSSHSETPSATTGRRTLSARVSSVPRCFHPIPIRRKGPAFLNWWRRYAVPSAWRNPIPTGSGCQGIDTLNKDF